MAGFKGKESLCKSRHASPKQVMLLERVFAVEPFPTSATRCLLSEVLLRMSPKRVAVWFKNKRARKKEGIPLPHSASLSSFSLSLAARAALGLPEPGYLGTGGCALLTIVGERVSTMPRSPGELY